MIRRVLLTAVGLVAVSVGGVYAVKQGYVNPAQLLGSAPSSLLPQGMGAGTESTDSGSADVLGVADHAPAESIRGLRAGELKLPFELPSFQDVSQASLSAEINTTPAKVFKTLREEGGQAVLRDLAQNAQLSVNGVTSGAVGEARYQYCLGVVQEYESKQASTE